MKRAMIAIVAVMIWITAMLSPTYAQSSGGQQTLFQNVRIFDGQNEELAESMSVLVVGNKIVKIAKSIPAPAGATVINGNGPTLMPGIIYPHVHLALAAVSFPELLIQLPSYTTIISVLEAEKVAGTLHLRGAKRSCARPKIR